MENPVLVPLTAAAVLCISKWRRAAQPPPARPIQAFKDGRQQHSCRSTHTSGVNKFNKCRWGPTGQSSDWWATWYEKASGFTGRNQAGSELTAALACHRSWSLSSCSEGPHTARPSASRLGVLLHTHPPTPLFPLTRPPRLFKYDLR